jgi:predicted RNase H-like HicB family nuclease
MNCNGYEVRVDWSEEDGGFVASCAEFPGVSAFGATAEAAAAEMEAALELAVETHREEGWVLPEPRLPAR